jgi:hypothetical protein
MAFTHLSDRGKRRGFSWINGRRICGGSLVPQSAILAAASRRRIHDRTLIQSEAPIDA